MAVFDTKLSVWYHNYVPERFPTVSKPAVVGYFSVDSNRSYNSSAINLKYLKLPPVTKHVNLDLNRGYKNVIHKPESSSTEGLTHLLQSIAENKCKLFSSEENSRRYFKCDFISFRGLLRLIMCSPYETKEDYCILATKFKGNIYLCQQETDEDKIRSSHGTERKKFCSYGFKFEQYLLTDDPTKEPDTTCPVNECEEFACLFKSSLEGIELLYAAEMDGIVSDEPCDMTAVDPNTLDFIELKVRRKEMVYKNYLRFNLRKWWCQSFLVGINRIYVGLRNDAGFVKEINIVDMRLIPKIAKDFWSPAVCMDFLKKFLDMVKNVTNRTNCPHTVFEFYWNPKSQKTVTYKYYKGKNELSFLPDWFVSSLDT